MKQKFYPAKIFAFFFSAFVGCSVNTSAQNVHIYASPNGSSTGTGSTEGAPVTLNQAKAVARANQTHSCIIYLEDGIYPAFSLDATDTRPGTAPAIYTAINKWGAIIQPEATLTASMFSPIPDSIKGRIVNATAKTKVVQISLSKLNFTDTAQWPLIFSEANMKTPRFYNNGIPLPMSRYPADGTFMPMHKVITMGSGNSIPGGSFQYLDDRAKYWTKALTDGGVWLSGNWQAQFEMDVVKTASINTVDSVITQSIGILGGLGAQTYGRLVSGQEPYYALNLVEEIAAEGQWSINYKTKMLYMWFPASGTVTCDGNSTTPALLATGVSNTQFMNLAIRGGNGNGVELHNCMMVGLSGSHITYCSGNAVTITDGMNCLIQSNDMDSVGAGGVIISSSNFTADQYNMKLSGHQVINNHIYSFAREAFLYSGALNVMNALGTYCAYNKIHDAPHVGVLYGGNNNVLEYNEVYDVVKKYADMGAFYKVEQGGLWLSRGNKIHHNYIHDAPAANGLYADNYCSGDSSNYNIIESVSLAIFDHYGYFNAYANNVLTNDEYPVTTMAEATTSTTYAAHLSSLSTVWNASAAYKKAYPECADLVGPSGRNNAYTSRIWPSVTGCAFVSNKGLFSNINNDKFFNADGTTNAAYAATTEFTLWQTVATKNFRVSTRTTPIYPYNLDSLKLTGAFGHTDGTDWHLNRIGIHKDSYRTDITALKIAGADPLINLTDTSTNGFKTPGNVTLTIGIKLPNAANILSSMTLYDNGKVMTGLSISKKPVSYDSVAYIITWVNPAAGTHSVLMMGNDGDGTFWQYSSNTVNIKIIAATQTTSDSTVTHIVSADNLVTDADSVAVKTKSDSSDLSTGSLSLYPNPARDLITVNYTSTTSGNANVLVYDLLGRVLVKKAFTVQEGQNQLPLPLNIPNGIYVLVLQKQNSPATSQRFMIQH